MRTVCIIQARVASTRLPRKVLADIAGRSMIDHVIERASMIKAADPILNMPSSDEVELSRAGIGNWAVPHQEQDVLASFLYIAEKESADVIMRLTGDCPLLDPSVCSDLLSLFLDSGVEYATTSQPWTQWADGLDCEVFSRPALERACHEAILTSDREHVCPWMAQNCLMTHLPAPVDLSMHKWSVDTAEDLDRVRLIYDQLSNMVSHFGMTSWRTTLAAWEMAARIRLQS